MYLSMLRVSRRLLRVRPGVEGCAVLLFNEDSAMRHRQALTISNVCTGLPRDYRLQLFASFATSRRSFASQTNDTSDKPDAEEREPSPTPGAGGGGWFPWLSDIDDETKVIFLHRRMSKTIQANTTSRQEKQGNEKPRQHNTKTERQHQDKQRKGKGMEWKGR